jgi:hypothetical protein
MGISEREILTYISYGFIHSIARTRLIFGVRDVGFVIYEECCWIEKRDIFTGENNYKI